MATRNITDCVDVLANAWNKALPEWIQQYPQQPIPFLTNCYRDNAEQQADFNQGRTTPGKIITWALPGQSPHNYMKSFAFDIAFKKEDGSCDWDIALYQIFAKLIMTIEPQIEYGGNWPGNKKDSDHFQVANWTTLIPKVA